MDKCNFPNNFIIKPDGIHELSPCIYEEVERWGNVTVSIRRCKNCGDTVIRWYKQDDTVELDVE